jgi:tetratricopeptide (TPR) repeat protein
VLAAAAALAGLVVGLLTHFASPATGILGGLLVGITTATGTRGRASAQAPSAFRTVRTGALAAWCIALAVATAAEIPLLRGLEAPDAVAADRAFSEAAALRPWDADLASIAAQSLTARADAGQPGAAGLAVVWADRALAVTPHSAPAALARGVALRLAGDPEASIAQLDDLGDRLPDDPDTAVQLALSLAAVGRAADAERELRRALASDPDHPVASALLDRVRGASAAD